MRRKTFDLILTAGGAVLTVVLIVAGALLMWGYTFTNSNVHDQLAQQQITFPAQGSKSLAALPPADRAVISQYAGQQVLTGQQAEAYANHYIAVHLSEMPYHGVYSQVSEAARANPNNPQLQAEVQTTFQGTTLRGLLLEAYAFSVFGTISLIAAIASFALALVMLVLTILGLVHYRRVPEEVEFPSNHRHEEAAAA